MFAPGQIIMDVRYILANSAPTPRPTKHHAPIFTPRSARHAKRRTSAGASGIGAPIFATGTRPAENRLPACKKLFLAANIDVSRVSPSTSRQTGHRASGILLLLLVMWWAPLLARAEGGNQ